MGRWDTVEPAMARTSGSIIRPSGCLFTVLEPHDLPWEPIVWQVNLSRTAHSRLEAALAPLLRLLRDFAPGWIQLGFGTHRGTGAVRVHPIKFRCWENRCGVWRGSSGGPSNRAGRYASLTVSS